MIMGGTAIEGRPARLEPLLEVVAASHFRGSVEQAVDFRLVKKPAHQGRRCFGHPVHLEDQVRKTAVEGQK